MPPARPGPKGGSCRPAGRARGGGERPQATWSARVTRGHARISLTQSTERFPWARGGHRPAQRPVPAPPLPRPARGATAGERPRRREPPREGAAAAQDQRGPPGERHRAPRGTAAPSRSAGGGATPGKAGTAGAALGKPRSALLPLLPPVPPSHGGAAGTCQRRPPLPYLSLSLSLPPPPARSRRGARSARSVRAPAAAQREAPAPTGASGAGPRPPRDRPAANGARPGRR